MQWIKVFTNIFANPKMQLLLKERDGDTFFRIWIQLLVIAGVSMQGGKIMMSENTPMTVENLATITHKSNKKIQNILDKLIHFEMLICEDNIYKITKVLINMNLLRNKIEKDKKGLEKIKKVKITLM